MFFSLPRVFLMSFFPDSLFFSWERGDLNLISCNEKEKERVKEEEKNMGEGERNLRVVPSLPLFFLNAFFRLSFPLDLFFFFLRARKLESCIERDGDEEEEMRNEEREMRERE